MASLGLRESPGLLGNDSGKGALSIVSCLFLYFFKSPSGSLENFFFLDFFLFLKQRCKLFLPAD